jgi:nucleoside-diphosphate-sugar epimerase
VTLLTGGSGFIGSHLVQQLLASGEAVRVLEHPAAVVNHLPLQRLNSFEQISETQRKLPHLRDQLKVELSGRGRPPNSAGIQN